MSPVQSIGPLFYIDGPLPRAPRYTLVGAADINPESDEHWANGIQVHGYIPDSASGYGVCDVGNSGSSGDPAVKLSQETPNPLPEYGPLTVYLTETCSTKSIMIGGQEASNDAFRARAAATFAAVESGALEEEFWTGAFLPDNPHLASADADVVTSGAVGLREGLALLERAIAQTNRFGVIHMSAALAAAYSTLGGGAGVLIPERGKLYTLLGTLVIPGSGYPGTSPDGEQSGTVEWAYATGPVEILRSGDFIMPPNLVEAINREQNEIEYRAERYYIPYWDTALHAAAEIDLCLTNCSD